MKAAFVSFRDYCFSLSGKRNDTEFKAAYWDAFHGIQWNFEYSKAGIHARQLDCNSYGIFAIMVVIFFVWTGSIPKACVFDQQDVEAARATEVRCNTLSGPNLQLPPEEIKWMTWWVYPLKNCKTCGTAITFWKRINGWKLIIYLTFSC